MRTKIISRESVAILSMDDVKNHVRVDDDYDLDLLNIYLEAATDIAENQTNRLVTPCVVDAYVIPFSEKIFLPYGAVRKIVSVTATNTAKESVDVDFTFNIIDESVNFSETLYYQHTDFIIRYECGYLEFEVPSAIKQGMLLLVGTLYNVREDVSYGVQATKVPLTSQHLFNSHRIHSGG